MSPKGTKPFCFIKKPEGILTIAAAIVGVITMTMLFQPKGFVRLMGIGHIYWVPLAIWFWTCFELAPPGSLLRYWMGSIIVLTTISIVIDIINIVRKIKGDRDPYVS